MAHAEATPVALLPRGSETWKGLRDTTVLVGIITLLRPHRPIGGVPLCHQMPWNLLTDLLPRLTEICSLSWYHAGGLMTHF